MNSRQSDRPQCGVLLPNRIRHFCRRASCRACVRYSIFRRTQIFIRRCELSSDFGASVSFIAPLGETFSFENFRPKIHDRIDHRRTLSRQWWGFGLIARFDGCSVRGVARLGAVGTDDFRDLIGPAEIAVMKLFDAATVSQTLMTGPFVPLPGSVKNIVLTVNPRPYGRRARTATRSHEPMPIIF